MIHCDECGDLLQLGMTSKTCVNALCGMYLCNTRRPVDALKPSHLGSHWDHGACDVDGKDTDALDEWIMR